MYPLLLVLLFSLPSSLTDKYDSASAYKLATFVLNNDNDDALGRLKCSARRYDIDFKILDVGENFVFASRYLE